MHQIIVCSGKLLNATLMIVWNELSLKNLKLYGPLLWMGFNCLKATGAIRGDNLLFTISPQKFLVYTHLSNHRRMKGRVNLGAMQ